MLPSAYGFAAFPLLRVFSCCLIATDGEDKIDDILMRKYSGCGATRRQTRSAFTPHTMLFFAGAHASRRRCRFVISSAAIEPRRSRVTRRCHSAAAVCSAAVYIASPFALPS